VTWRAVGRGTLVRVAGVAVLATLAVLAALLASDVRAWRFALDRGDAVYAVAPGIASWTPSTRLGGLADSILEVGDELSFRQGLVLYRQVVAQQELSSNELGVETLRAQAESRLAGAASSPDLSLASRARTLLGILAFGASASGGGISETDAAISDFTDAAIDDPTDTAAKFDLELLLRLTAAKGERTSTGPNSSYGRTGLHSASGGVPGSGY
jgi:hypothetical protein